jgi:ATP-dependent protease ClpP protease subunit
VRALALALAATLAFAGGDARADGPPDLATLLAALDDGGPMRSKPVVPKGEVYVAVAGVAGEVDESMSASVRKFLSRAVEDGADAVVLAIDSGGGDLDAAREIVHAIEGTPIRVICVADGEVCSAALVIHQACDTRLMTKRATLMAHRPGVRMRVRSDEVATAAERMRVLDEAVLQAYARKSKIRIEEWRRRTLSGAEMWFDWRDAKRDGMVDAVVDSPRAAALEWRRHRRLPKSL